MDEEFYRSVVDSTYIRPKNKPSRPHTRSLYWICAMAEPGDYKADLMLIQGSTDRAMAVFKGRVIRLDYNHQERKLELTIDQLEDIELLPGSDEGISLKFHSPSSGD